MAGAVTVVTGLFGGAAWALLGDVANLATGIALGSWLQTVSGLVVWTTTSVAGNLARGSWSSAESRLLWLGAVPGDVTGVAAVETTLDAALGLDMTGFTTVVALLELDGSWHSALGLDVARLVAVVTQPFGLTAFGQMADLPTNKTGFLRHHFNSRFLFPGEGKVAGRTKKSIDDAFCLDRETLRWKNFHHADASGVPPGNSSCRGA